MAIPRAKGAGSLGGGTSNGAGSGAGAGASEKRISQQEAASPSSVHQTSPWLCMSFVAVGYGERGSSANLSVLTDKYLSRHTPPPDLCHPMSCFVDVLMPRTGYEAGNENRSGWNGMQSSLCCAFDPELS
ncbi:hypothetical protein HZH68_008523 [Vespula germanica]|uniref:Uncharacterized protein n=2 Tax=Vespula TaxID=7451 RepID=A0A834K183_VESGE|nr:hypothetical protein HZH68_008523 [Vespula germanica]KAF7421731.1 hypothetical protein H0235_009567 [Vespula pensylvanica]